MDPNANLAEQQEILDRRREYDRAVRKGTALPIDLELMRYYRVGDKNRLQELRDALAQWLARGGFAPDWDKYPNARKYYRSYINRRIS